MPRKQLTIEVPTGVGKRQDGTHEVTGSVFGDLLVHKTWYSDYSGNARYAPPLRRGWTITHIPTRLAIHTSFDSKKDAEKVARQLKGLDWDFERGEDCPAGTKIAAADAIREYRNLVSYSEQGSSGA